MSSPLRLLAVSVLGVSFLALGTFAQKAEVPKTSQLREDAHYEFRGHIYDRSTIDRTFTLYWSEGSQPIMVSPQTKIFRHGKVAQLGQVKSGDAVRGVGVVKKGRLIAVAVAFGDEGVELPAALKVPEAITLPSTRDR